MRKIVLIIFRSSLYVGHLGSKTMTQGFRQDLKIEKSCSHSREYIFSPNIGVICQKGCFDDYNYVGHLRSKTRTQCLEVEKSC